MEDYKMATEKSLQILESIKALTILELADLVKAVEEEFGVSAAAPVAVAGAAAAAPAAEEKTEFDVVLKSFGAKKLDVIKVIRLLMVALRSQGNWRWEGALGTPLGLVHWKRASSPVEAGTAGYL